MRSATDQHLLGVRQPHHQSHQRFSKFSLYSVLDQNILLLLVLGTIIHIVSISVAIQPEN